MYNPFPLLSEAMLHAEMANGKRFFVRQYFVRGMDTHLKAAFLLRAYPGEEKDQAERHLAAIERDRHAFLYDALVPEHLGKLRTAASQPFGFRVYYAAKKGRDWKPPAVYDEKMKRYIRRHHGHWRTTRGGDKIEVGLYEEFGELYINFSYQGEEDRIPFNDIEKY
jgi:hypothetical protein